MFVFAIGSLAVYGVILGGWSPTTSTRCSARCGRRRQIISYEIPLGMSILGVLLFAGSLNLEKIIDWQRRRTAGTSCASRWRSCCS